MRVLRRARPYNRSRLWLVVGLFGIGFLAIVGRLYSVQILHRAEYQELASQQYMRRLTLRPERGRILDRGGRVLATSIPVPSLYAIPHQIADVDTAAARLAGVLQQSRATLRRRLAKSAPFVWIARQLSPATAARVQALGIAGIHVQQEPRRYYPKRHLAGQVLGFVGIDEQGLGGLEYQYDAELSGRPRRIVLQRDAVGRRVRLLAGGSAEPPHGADLYLTLDEWIQHLAEREIAAQVRRTRARSGLVIAMQPHTGYILAMAAYPFFDPNRFRRPEQQVWQRNRAVTDPIEPGSTFKLVVAAASLEERTVAPDDMFFCERGVMAYGRRLIRDHKPYGMLSFTDVFVHSSNIGVVKISERLSSFRLYQYIRRFGFGEKSFVDLPGESAGQLRPPQEWSRFSHASLAIGQEIAVTPLQLAAAFAAVANGGELMQPRLVRRIDYGQDAKLYAPEVRWRVLSPPTAQRLTSILTQVVERGTGRRAAIAGYTVAGKTGTAQKVDTERGGYSRRKVVTSFVGYVPADAPQLVILVVLDEPQTLKWGGQSAAPVFQRIAQQALPYLQIPPAQARTLPSSTPGGRDHAARQGETTPARFSHRRDFVRVRLARTRE